MKIRKDNHKIILGFLMGILLIGGTVYATGVYRANEVICELGNTTITTTNVQDAIDELATKYATLTECPREMVCTPKKTTLSVGDYIRYYPNKTVAYTDPAKTGYGSQQEFNPSELTLWRVIRINQDGTVDIISDNISSKGISFYGITGYGNLVGTLNELASEYENDTYTVGSRYFGYNGQIEFITDNITASNNFQDTLYTTDYDLVNSVYGSFICKTVSGNAGTYWVASRQKQSNSEGNCCSFDFLYGRMIMSSGELLVYGCNGAMCAKEMYLQGFYGSGPKVQTLRLRPIVTLKSTGLTYLGGGTKKFPMEIYTN